MSDDKMRAEFEQWAKAVGHDLSQTKGDDRYWFVSTESAWESWQAGYQAGQKAEREAIFIEWENGELLASEVERLRAEVEILAVEVTRLQAIEHERMETQTELAAAKAASELPVGITDLSLCGGGQRIEFYIEGDKTDGGKMLVWLRDRMKDKTPHQA